MPHHTEPPFSPTVARNLSATEVLAQRRHPRRRIDLPYHRGSTTRCTRTLPLINVPPDWTRRQFLLRSAALATLAGASPLRAWAGSESLREPRLHPAPGATPEVASPTLTPLLDGSTARPLRYIPEGRAFVIRNGRELFNRPLYGPNNAFRVDAGDLPEFSLYLPGHGGNLRIGIARPSGARWLLEADEVIARYISGQMLYTIRDPLLGKGSVELHLVTAGEGAGLHLAVSARDTPSDLLLTWAFGGVSGRKGRRGGDIGCEIEPVSRFFQLQPGDCNRNSFKIRAAAAELQSESAKLNLTFPPGSRLHISEAARWNSGWQALQQVSEDAAQPILIGSVPLDSAGADSPLMHLLIRSVTDNPAGKESPSTTPAAGDPSVLFASRLKQLALTTSNFNVSTPDPFVDAAVGALAHATDAIWDEAQQSVMHGAVAWRTPLAGWRGPYALDALGHHHRMGQHLRHWVAHQNQTPLPSGQDPDAQATGPADPGSDLTRHEALLHTSGDLSGNHYDMNLVFFDAFVRHLRWTGDIVLAREIWPALVRHMDWEYRSFRRAFTNPQPGAPPSLQTLPLYEAYACIWASDNLQYNGGGATHATAYNLFLNRSAATIARVLGEDPAPYDDEADLIREGMHQLLWMPEAGAFAESRDILLPQTLQTSPALWSAYHSVDSELPSPRQAWQIVTDRLSALRRVPIHGEGVPDGPWFLLPCSDWLPYTWSLNLLALAENMHFALALWQAGLPEEAFALFKGNLLDSMFQGLCPGNFHLSSQLDPHRQESQRDFADPIGITSRALVEGLFGILPDLLRATLTIRPGFPSTWNQAALHHPDIDLTWHRDGLSETLEITSRLPHPVALTLNLPARTTSDPVVLSNGLAFPFAFDPDATGAPRIILTNFPAATAWKIDIRWHGHPPPEPPARATYAIGDTITLPPGVLIAQIDDPQACLQSGVATTPGNHAVFVPIRQGSCRFWLPISLDIHPKAAAPQPSTTPAAETYDPLDLSDLLKDNLPDILTRDYTAPRSPFCSLALPRHLLGGWANFDVTATIDDSGLRAAGGTLRSAFDIPFSTPSDPAKPNCRLLSFWQPDHQRVEISLSGNAHTLYLLMTGTTFPQASRTVHGAVTVLYTDGSTSVLTLRNADTWWPVEQDYLFDDFLFRASGPLPPRIDLRSGKTRILDLATFKGQGRPVPGGAATLLHLPLHPDRTLSALQVECTLYGVVLGLISATLGR